MEEKIKEIKEKIDKIKKTYNNYDNEYNFNQYLNDKRILLGMGLLLILSYKLREYMQIDNTIDHKELFRLIDKD